MLTFIHTADIHLDSPLQGLERYEGAPVEEIRGATRRALENLVQLAIDRKVDFIVVAGDVYDGNWKDHNTGLFFVRQMSRLRDAGIPVVMISGNHDAANKMTKSLPLPDNVEVLSAKQAQTAKMKKLAELGVAIHGRSFANAAEFANLVRDYPDKQSGLLNIGVLHTSLTGVEGHEPYAPCTVDELLQKGYDYWALGHVHAAAVVCDNPPIVFCGNVQGRHARETGPKGCYVVSVDDLGKATADFQPLDVFRWDTCVLDISGAQRPDEVMSAFATALLQVMERNAGIPLAIRVILMGRSQLHSQLAADPLRWTEDIRAVALDTSGGSVWVEKVKIQTSAANDACSQPLSDGPIGGLLQYLNDLHSDETQLRELLDELADLRRKLPGELLRGDDPLAVDRPDDVRRWLHEVEPLLLGRLIDGGKP